MANILRDSLWSLLDCEVSLYLSLVDTVDGDPCEVAANYHAPDWVPHTWVRVKIKQL
jgi:hypothetical protein